MAIIENLSDLQKVLGEKPLNFIQPIIQPVGVPPKVFNKGKIILYGVLGVVGVVGLYSIFKNFHEWHNDSGTKNKELDEMKQWMRKQKEEEEQKKKVEGDN